MTVVQEPPDVPKWVNALEDGYQRLTTSVMRANHEFHYTNMLVRNLHVHSIEGNFNQDVLHKNASQFAEAVFKKLGEELSLKGVSVVIPPNDLPEKILPMNLKDFKDPLSFSPIKLYQYLFEKYAGQNSQILVLSRAAVAFTRNFGHHGWEFVDAGSERARQPKLDTFFEKSFEQKGDFYHGYITATPGETWGAIANMIDWKYDSRGQISQALNQLADLLHLVDRGDDIVGVARTISTIVNDKASGQNIPYGQKANHGNDMVITFRKGKMEFKFSTALMDVIRTFLLSYHPDFQR
jgi:hypothetical protein